MRNPVERTYLVAKNRTVYLIRALHRPGEDAQMLEMVPLVKHSELGGLYLNKAGEWVPAGWIVELEVSHHGVASSYLHVELDRNVMLAWHMVELPGGERERYPLPCILHEREVV